MAIADRNDFYDAVVAWVLAKQEASGFESLTEFERILSRAIDCKWRAMQGTLLDEVFEGRERAEEVLAVLDEIAAASAAAAFRTAIDLYFGLEPELRSASRSLEDWTELIGKARWEALAAEIVDEDVEDCFFNYVNEHRHRLRSD